MARILLVEDDREIVRTLSAYLQQEGFETDAAPGEKETCLAVSGKKVDLLLVDLSLENGDGFGVCRAAREAEIPLIFLTASGDEDAVVRGLDMGAEDYIIKPFRPRELVSRIRRILGRSENGDGRITVGGLVLDPERGTVARDGEEILLSALEYRLLLLFFTNRGRLLTRDRLLEDIWDAAGDFVNDNTLTVYIKRLREKIEKDPQNPAVIKTVRGMGYRVD